MLILVLSTVAPSVCVNLFVKSNVTVVNKPLIAIALDTGLAFVALPFISIKSIRRFNAEVFFIFSVTVGLVVIFTELKLYSTFSHPGPTALGVTTSSFDDSLNVNFPAGILFQFGSSTLSLKFSNIPV